MGDNSSIEWIRGDDGQTGATWNPIIAINTETEKRGSFCVHKSEGCRNCWASKMNVFRGTGLEYIAQNLSKHRFEIIRNPKSQRSIDWPIRVKRPRKIFPCSMTDLFASWHTDEMINQVFQTMYTANWHTFMVITKEPERMLDYISQSAFLSNAPLSNVWLGVSVEDQNTADERIPLLLETPAAVRWISAEPLLGPIDLSVGNMIGGAECYCGDFVAGEHGPMGKDPCRVCRCKGVRQPWSREANRRLDWVVVGGESGPGARPMHPNWARSLRDQCKSAGVSFFFKQWGNWVLGPHGNCGHDSSDGAQGPVVKLNPQRVDIWRCNICGALHNTKGLDFANVGKKTAGRILDGREWNEYPSIAEGGA